ncbi:MAG: class I SAM-dependent methyltransferase [Opitutales bacterium]|nr:class I SAM-dependent methyltransferase [Opitutales bacterium]
MEAHRQISIQLADWEQFQLIDSGDGKKLEKWGDSIVIRPEPKALWPISNPSLWSRTDAICDENEQWKKAFKKSTIRWKHGIRFNLRMWQKSKHLGLFPEQEPHWRWIEQQTKPGDRVANLFAYTGSASLVAAKAGAKVTHVDASEPAVKTARQNAASSGLQEAPVRWIVEDVMTYLKREERRGSQYEGILLDPPSFGRGPKGQLWKIEAVSELIGQCRKCLSNNLRYVLLTMYNLEASSLTLENLMQPFVEMGAELSVGELALKEQKGGRYLPLSLYARALWK